MIPARIPLLVAALMGALGACTWTQVLPTRDLPPETARPTPTPAATASSDDVKRQPTLPPEDPEDAANAPLGSPILKVVAIEGASLDTARNLFQPTSVARCKPSEPGFLRVVVTSGQEGTAMIVDPNSSANAAMSECVLKALSIMDIDDVLQPSASDSTSQVQSILTVSW